MPDGYTDPSLQTSQMLRCWEEGFDLAVETGGIEPQWAGGQYARANIVRSGAGMMRNHARFRVQDQVMMHARQAQIASKLRLSVPHRRAGG